MNRIILHSDADSYYASVECLYTPALRGRPMAVCGSPDDRHGIVLAKSEPAKRLGVKTGMAIWQAKALCPSLQCVPPDFDLYLHFSQKLRRIYQAYTDKVEPFGLDECWMDVSAAGMDWAQGERLAHAIRRRIRRETGLTVSIGVSDNKVFAKLASDYKKPNAVTRICPENYRQAAWPLPMSSLIYAGPHTCQKLARLGLYTIGDLARADAGMLEARLGKNGIMLKAFALGLDQSPVKAVDAEETIKSVGNSTTPPHDIRTPDEARAILYLLAESVGERLRKSGLQGRTVSVTARNPELVSHTRQRTLPLPTASTGQIACQAIALFEQQFSPLLPFRSLGLNCGQLSREEAPVQMDFLGEAERNERAQRLDQALDSLRYRFGHTIIRRGIVLADPAFNRVNPAGQVIHPVAFLREDGVSYARP